MEIKRKIINDNKWELINEYWETYNAWGHKTTVLRNGHDYGSHKVRYYNRTWEMYTYQTCMSGAIYSIKSEELDNYIRRYKEKNDIKRFKKGEKEKVIEEFNNTELGKELQILKEAINERKFDY